MSVSIKPQSQLVRSGFKAAITPAHEAMVTRFLALHTDYDNTLWDQGNFMFKQCAEKGCITELYYCPFTSQSIKGDDLYVDVETM